MRTHDAYTQFSFVTVMSYAKREKFAVNVHDARGSEVAKSLAFFCKLTLAQADSGGEKNDPSARQKCTCPSAHNKNLFLIHKIE